MESINLSKFKEFEVENTNSIAGGYVTSEIDCTTWNDVVYSNGSWDKVGVIQDYLEIIVRNTIPKGTLVSKGPNAVVGEVTGRTGLSSTPILNRNKF